MLYILQLGAVASSVVTETGQLAAGQGDFLQNLMGGLLISAAASQNTASRELRAVKAKIALGDILANRRG